MLKLLLWTIIDLFKLGRGEISLLITNYVFKKITSENQMLKGFQNRCNWICKYTYQGRIQGVGAPPPLKLEKIWFFCVKSWFFTRNTPKFFAPPSARRNFLKCAPPPLTWNPGSAPVYTISKYYRIYINLFRRMSKKVLIVLQTREISERRHQCLSIAWCGWKCVYGSQLQLYGTKRRI